MSNIRRLGVLVAIAVLVVGIGGIAQALKAPHDVVRLGGGCNLCHVRKSAPNTGFAQMSSFDSFCFNGQNGCHRAIGGNAPKKAIDRNMASDRFKNIIRNSGYALYSTNKKQSSHGWKIPNTNSDAGATNDWHPMIEAGGSVQLTTRIGCTRCHRAHGDFGPKNQTIYRSFLKADPKGDNICFQCHSARQVGEGDARTYRDTGVAGAKYQSHPVEVNYSSVRTAKPTFFETAPTLTAGYNESARPRLYTTIGGVKGAVVCSSCHGPLHAADSNPYTYDNLTSYVLRSYSSSAGNLLRGYPMSKAGHENNLCKSCHKVSAHKSFNKCSDCHEPHKKPGDSNLYLIKKIIATPYGNHSVFFISTSQMALRYGIYSLQGGVRTQRSTAVCQVCHRNTPHHRSYSTTGADREHNYLGGKYKNCVGCHKHVNANSTGAFKPEGCNGCHNDPPTIGRHAKHVGDSSGYNTWKWNEGKMYDQRSASSYGFSCGRCHNPWVPYTAGVNSTNKYEGKNHYGVGTPDPQKVYTSDIGFKNGSPLPQNPFGSYSYGGAGIVDRPYSVNFRTPSTGKCSNLYCHGQFYGGYTSNNPNFNGGTQSCVGSCHGTNAAKLPGVNGTGEWGAHRRHIGSGSQQYGSGAPNFRCNACHNATASLNNETTVTSRIYHVNGKTNVRFAPAYGYSGSRYKGLNDYSTATNITLGSKTAYQGTCNQVYCHSDGSRTDSATQGGYSSSGTYPSNPNTLAAYPNWSSTKNFTSFGGTTTKRRCARCHGSSYHGITAAMPGYVSRPGKGNSHAKHVVVNGFMCRVCHSLTVGTDNRSIADTTLHVNGQYNIDILASYGGSYNGTSDTCTNVKCHGLRQTQPWGTNNANNCKDCHFSSTGDIEGYADSYKFRNFSVTASTPKIYSTEWAGRGHGTSYAGNKICTDCHKQSGNISHQAEVSSNAFRIFTAPTHIDDLCLECHTNDTSRSKYGQANVRDIQTHFSSGWAGWGNAQWSFRPKCIDCHDPHGDKNKYMIHTYINYSGSSSTGKRTYDTTQTSGYMTFSTVGGGLKNWSSYVNPGFTGLCQRCHNTQNNLDHFNKAAKSGGGYDAGHNPKNACTGCHKHSTGFKGMACNGCHKFPPTLSGKHSFHVATSVAMTHVLYDVNSTKTKYAFGCGKCHDTTQHYAGFGVFTADLNFDSSHSLPRNGNASYAFGARSSLDRGAFGNETSKFRWVSTKGTCKNLYCHGQFFGGYSSNNPTWYGSQPCGSCHGASQSNPPSTNGVPSGAHAKHVTTYAFKCRFCHRDTTGGFDAYTVANRSLHVNGQTDIRLYTTETRIRGNARYGNAGGEYANITTNTNPGVAPTYRFCKNIYCHSNGTNTTSPFALPNYTAKWDRSNLPASAGEGCSYCHGSKKTAGGYAGITSAMPNYPNNQPKWNSHKKHVVENGFTCYACHKYTVASDGRTIASTTYHINANIDVKFAGRYSGVGGPKFNGDGTCSNIKCHGGRTTPVWGNSVLCSDCHYQGSGAGNAEDKFVFTQFTSSVPKIYSSEWMNRGHGRSKASGVYPFSNNTGAGKNCYDCHKASVNHNSANNFFRLITSNPDMLCARCHGTGAQLQGTFRKMTGIQSHTWQNISTNGYKGGNNGKANANGGWNFTPKCVDCHDPHGDKNNYMIHTYSNMSGSDTQGRPLSPYKRDETNYTNFTAVNGGAQIGWSSFVRGGAGSKYGLCQRCHSVQTGMGFFTKTSFTITHNSGKRCTMCHKHKKGFTPTGCDACHAYPPAPGPSGWRDSASNYSSLHIPHAKNLKNMSGIPAENDVTPSPGYKCNRCHGGVAGSSDTGQSSTHGAGVPGKVNASMQNLTTNNGGYGKWSKGAFNGATSVADDTCWSVKCHTPRAYTRQWRKPSGCSSCHGYTTRFKGAGNSRYNLHTTNSHKIHVNYTGSNNPPAAWKKNYGFACTQCHVNNGTNYTSHYNGKVDMNFKTNSYNLSTSAQYSRGTRFKGFTTGNEATLGSCSKAYCHGRFSNGTTATVPQWKKGASQMTCISCHKGRLTFGNGSTMPERHPKHAKTNMYGFACARCHSRTTNNITTILLTYSSHVNGRKDIYFDNFGNQFNANGTFDVNMKCKNIYCHSSGARALIGVFTTRTTLGNFTANWNDSNLNTKTGNRPCSYCHGSKAYTGITAAMPNYTSMWGNSHRKHVIVGGFSCYVCHSATVNSSNAIQTKSNHVNGFKNVTILTAYKTGQELYSSQATAVNKTCKNIRCHAGNKTPKWGSYARCQTCHFTNAGDTDKRISANNSFQNFSGKVNPTVAKIYSSQWANTGHGRSGGAGNPYTVSGNSAAGQTCTNCHGSGETRGTGGNVVTKHGTANNPFRLLTTPTNPNGVCNICHGVGGTGSGKTGIQSHASSITGQGHNYAMKCIDCHDPHGDNNGFMVHSTIARPSSSLTRKESSNLYGQLFYNATSRNVDFTAKNYSSDYAKKITAPKICQTCHTQTQKPRSSTRTRFRWNDTKDLPHGTDKCTGCHSHSGGFKGVSCSGCHGFPPTSKQNMLTSTTNGQKEPFSGATSAGAHKMHTDKLGLSSDTCAYCHQGGMYASGAKNTKIDIGFKAFNIYTGNYGGKSSVGSGYYNYSGHPNGRGVTRTYTARCSVSCHGSGLLTASYGTVTAPMWRSGTNNSGKCGKCHGAKRAPGQDSWPMTNAHAIHAGTGNKQQNFMCKLCHNGTVQNTATSLYYDSSHVTGHVNGQADVAFDTSGTYDPRLGAGASYSYPSGTVNKVADGKCLNIYCHSKGTDRVAPFSFRTAFGPFTARWNDNRGNGGYKQGQGAKAKCNYCHGNTTWIGVTSAMPNYADNSPKANKHLMHVKSYGFLCTSCHTTVTTNNTSIDGATPGNHVNRVYNVDFNSLSRGGNTLDNTQGRYTSTNSGCRGTYCHSRGTKLGTPPYSNTTALANYTAHWGDSRGGYNKAPNTMAKCNYCHGNRTYSAMTSAMPNYPSGTPKANRHPKHVVAYGFTCTVCHKKVTTNNTSIDAAGGTALHVDKNYNVNFANTPTGRPQVNNTGIYKYQSGGTGSSCKYTYCHSRGTKFTGPYINRSSFSNFTAQWGDTPGSFRAAKGAKAKCNYCHGNKAFTGVTAAMPNYSTVANKSNTHAPHVVGYGFTCTACHELATTNNTSIDAAGGKGLHINGSYNVNFAGVQRGTKFMNNTGSYTMLGSKSRCKNTYCHSKGTKLAAPYNNKTTFSTFTAMWGDTRGGFRAPKGAKAKCNYCHGNKAFTGVTAAMPNYSSYVKPNSHSKHVIGNGIMCKTCHNNIAMNNTSISDRTRHVNGFYNISIEPAKRGTTGQKVYSMVYNGTGGICMNNTCHSASKPQWGNPATANCKSCHLDNTADTDDNATQNSIAAKIYSTEWVKTGHGRASAYKTGNPGAGKTCLYTGAYSGCHSSNVPHNSATNPFRMYTAANHVDDMCKQCHNGAGATTVVVGHTAADMTAAGWNGGTNGAANWIFTPKCVDCHDPHGDKNNYMIHTQYNFTSSSNAYGQWQQRTQMTFSSVGATPVWGNYVNASNNGICQRCHSGTDLKMGNFNKVTYNATHNAGQQCTSCHKHNKGFAPVESSGNTSCDSCHSDFFDPMNTSTRSYHHVMRNTTAIGPNKYPINNTYTSNSPKRRCLMCHVDHNIFRPDINTLNTRGRGANLRANIFDEPTSNNATTYNNSDWSGTDSRGGICISCHSKPQYKSSVQVSDPSIYTLRIQTSQFRNSPHNFNVTSFHINGGTFKANCTKCHNDTNAKTKFDTSTGFSLHDSSLRRLNAKMGLKIYTGTVSFGSVSTVGIATSPWTAGKWDSRSVTLTDVNDTNGNAQTRIIKRTGVNKITIDTKKKLFAPAPTAGKHFTIGDPPEEELCFNCHSLSDNPNAGINKDYYGVADYVNVKALKMEQTFNGDYGIPRANSSSTNLMAAAAKTVVWVNGTTSGPNKVTGWAGYSVKITSGVGINQERTVWKNTTATLIVKPNWTKNPTTGSTYAIGNPYRHRIDQYAGQHASDEGLRAPAGITAQGWFSSTGTKLHVGCADCHNPHAQRKPGAERGTSTKDTFTTSTTVKITGKTWRTDQWRGYVLGAIDRSNAGTERVILSNTSDRMRLGAPFTTALTGVYVNILPRGRAFVVTEGWEGNMLNGPNNGQWGVNVTKWKKPPVSATTDFDNMSSPVFSKITTLRSGVDRVYNLCFKCHSKYGWGAAGSPFRIMDGGMNTLGTYSSGVSRDISQAVNPNNLSHHAIVQQGNNQPIRENYGAAYANVTSYYNIGGTPAYSRWPRWAPAGANSTLRIDTTGKARVTASSGGLPRTVIPGWFVYVGGNNPPARQQGTATKGYFQINAITNYTSFNVNLTGATVNNVTSFAISAGLGNAFVPPYGPWSVTSCADCHDTDGSADPSGPHGSGRNWILRKMEPQKFAWMNSTGNVRTIGWGVDSAWTGAYAGNTFCLNCHRADVYGNDGTSQDPVVGGAAPSGADYPGFKWRGEMSRETHNPEGSRNNAYDANLNTFRVVCMNCHGGNRSGQIHGTNMSKGVLGGNSYRGKRFLTGGAWGGVTRATTSATGVCVEGPSADVPASINSCGGSGTQAIPVANYDYDGGAD